MKKFLFIAFLIALKSYSQQNRFSGTWGNEKCKDCKKEFIFTITIAQSNSKIFGTAEVTSDHKELNSGILEVTGDVYPLGDKAQIKLKDKDGTKSSAVLFVNDAVIQFTKNGGGDVVPKEMILKKLYE
ncbi:hypothetical protein [Flavobacterium ginsenosidimutans]|uniref:Lipocalin-like domain-containing protein n=1 Tax=Flavobacterium ginsenosidimutans TaxID=687844 RepID=A0ABZ2QAK1_9FLAO|nr:hypothetical protein [Flavobacterium ginsenosidimutans]KAF2326797.1 hypothetical protein DM444_23245 [Flavobacterium ginsenosidimutans]